EAEELEARLEEERARAETAAQALPDVEAQVRAAGASREEMRSVLARVEQDLALVAQTQRDADRQLSQLAQRRERLEQELRELDAPDPAALERLAGEQAMHQEQLEEAQGQLAELEDRLPGLDETRAAAHAKSREEADAQARVE